MVAYHFWLHYYLIKFEKDACKTLFAVGSGTFRMEMMEMQVLQAAGAPHQGLDEDVRDTGDAAQVDMVPVAYGPDRLVSRYEVDSSHFKP